MYNNTILIGYDIVGFGDTNTEATHQLLKVDKVVMEGLISFMDKGDI